MGMIIIMGVVALACVALALSVAIAGGRSRDGAGKRPLPAVRERYGVDTFMRPVRTPRLLA